MDVRNRVPNIMSLSKATGISYSNLHKILSGKLQAGPKTAMRLEEATSGAITKSDLRPDLWPAESSVA